MVWERQESIEVGMQEAEQQQLRAVTQCTTDILIILAGLGYIELCPRPGRCVSCMGDAERAPCWSPKSLVFRHPQV